MDFNTAFDKLIDREGSYTSDYKDRGNWTTGIIGKGDLNGTKYGISAMSYPHLNIKNLSRDDAKKIYKRDFWDKMRLSDLPDDISFDMFDTAVNSGISRAVKILQKTVGSKEDGVIGNITISLSQLSKDGLSARYNANRLLFMTDLSVWDVYGKGWARRIANNILKS